MGPFLTPMGVAPKLIKGRTYIPARVPCAGLGAIVKWDAAARIVTVSTAPVVGETKTVSLPGGATLDLVWVPGGSELVWRSGHGRQHLGVLPRLV